ncbi:uncharacterized protein BDV17DRAFT_214657 [Aspergillus undulatus]|uniref:uncharacterized protein n=1 Tax=Aspergillus undulatus TaxID=1810928 RepID=UPI003CCCB208
MVQLPKRDDVMFPSNVLLVLVSFLMQPLMLQAPGTTSQLPTSGSSHPFNSGTENNNDRTIGERAARGGAAENEACCYGQEIVDSRC